ncbi:MAG: T9SS type A sorting domain-containing protein [Saprospiraceae bacterium]
MTADASLQRKEEIKGGTGPVVAVLGNTFDYTQWNRFPKNYFQNLQSHESVCENVSTVNLNQGEVKVYPNPVSGNEITLESPFQMNSIVVFDLAGRKVFQQNLGQNSGSIQINLGNLQKGMYNMVIDLGENGMISQKLVK